MDHTNIAVNAFVHKLHLQRACFVPMPLLLPLPQALGDVVGAGARGVAVVAEEMLTTVTMVAIRRGRERQLGIAAAAGETREGQPLCHTPGRAGRRGALDCTSVVCIKLVFHVGDTHWCSMWVTLIGVPCG